MNAINSTFQADLERLARGETIPAATFRAIVADPDAVRHLRRLLLVRSLLKGEEPSLDASDLPQTDVDFAELAEYLHHGRLPNPAREAVAKQLLKDHFPDLPDAVSDDTAIASDAETTLAQPASERDTQIEVPKSQMDTETRLNDEEDTDTNVIG